MLMPSAVENLSESGVETRAQVFEYRPKLWMVILGTLFFGGISWMTFGKALHNDRGMIINGLITLDARGATVVWWVMFLLSAGMAAVALLVAGPTAFRPKWIMLEDDAITLPRRGLSRQHDRLMPTEITSVTSTVVKGRMFVTVYARGRSYAINPAWLPAKSDLEPIMAWLGRHRS